MAFAARLVLLCAMAATTLGVTRPETLPQFLDRMRSQSGPVWRTHLTSTSILSFGDEMVNVRSEAQGVRFVTYQCAQTLCTGSYFDGDRVYSIDINGTALPQSDLPDTFLRAERMVASHAFLDPAFEDNGGHINDGGFTTIDSVRYRILLVSQPDTVGMQLFVDPSGLIRYLRDVNGDATLEYRDYRHIDGGLMLPFLVLRNGSVLERYDDRRALSTPFNDPHGLTPAFNGTALEIPTDPNRAIPLFTCSVGNVTTTCLLDTGNSGMAISSELVKQLDAPTVGEMQVAGLGRYSTDVVRTGPLSIGNVTFPNANYVVLNDIHRFGYDVVLGADVLAATRVKIDPVKHDVVFDAPAAPQKSVSVPVHFQDFVPIVAVQLGKLGAQLAVDTGDESNINLDYDFYNEHRDLFSATEQHTVTGVGGSSVELIGEIPNVRIGDLVLRDQRIGTTTTLHSTAYGHLGAGFLQQFTILIDYARGRVDFVAPPAPSH